MDLTSLRQEFPELIRPDCHAKLVGQGFSHDVYLLQDSTGSKFSLRVAKNDFATVLSQRGAAILRLIEESRASLPIPAIIHERKGYAIMRYLPGEAIHSWTPARFGQADRQHILRGLAECLFASWTINVTASGTPSTYHDWLLSEVDSALRRSIETSPRWGDPLHYLARRVTLSSVVPAHDDSQASIRHGDLNTMNVLINDGNFSGVVDWDTAQIVPLPAAVNHPLFVADIPGYLNEGVTEEMDFATDRKFLEAQIEDLASKSDSAAVRRIPELLSTSTERQFFELSLRNRMVNEQYVRLRLEGEQFDTEAMKDSLEDYVSKNKSMREDPAVQALFVRLGVEV